MTYILVFVITVIVSWLLFRRWPKKMIIASPFLFLIQAAMVDYELVDQKLGALFSLGIFLAFFWAAASPPHWQLRNEGLTPQG